MHVYFITFQLIFIYVCGLLIPCVWTFRSFLRLLRNLFVNLHGGMSPSSSSFVFCSPYIEKEEINKICTFIFYFTVYCNFFPLILAILVEELMYYVLCNIEKLRGWMTKKGKKFAGKVSLNLVSTFILLHIHVQMSLDLLCGGDNNNIEVYLLKKYICMYTNKPFKLMVVIQIKPM